MSRYHETNIGQYLAKFLILVRFSDNLSDIGVFEVNIPIYFQSFTEKSRNFVINNFYEKKKSYEKMLYKLKNDFIFFPFSFFSMPYKMVEEWFM